MHRVVAAADVYHRVAYHASQGSAVSWNGRSRWTVHQASRCERPLLIEWTGRGKGEGAFAPNLLLRRLEPWRPPIYVGRDKRGPLRLLDQWIPCRACNWCLAVRGRQWSERAVQEIAWGQRTWFGTLTLNPSAHYEMECRARAHLGDAGDMGQLAHNIYYVHKEISKEITLWLKRIRKESGAAIRYVIVAELHKSGRLHYHMLVTEEPGSPPIRHKTMKSQWKLGFSSFKLVDDNRKAAHYVAKYLSKSVLARVRASQRYGEPPALRGAIAAGEQLTKSSYDIVEQINKSVLVQEKLVTPRDKTSTTRPQHFPTSQKEAMRFKHGFAGTRSDQKRE